MCMARTRLDPQRGRGPEDESVGKQPMSTVETSLRRDRVDYSLHRVGEGGLGSRDEPMTVHPRTPVSPASHKRPVVDLSVTPVYCGGSTHSPLTLDTRSREAVLHLAQYLLSLVVLTPGVPTGGPSGTRRDGTPVALDLCLVTLLSRLPVLDTGPLDRPSLPICETGDREGRFRGSLDWADVGFPRVLGLRRYIRSEGRPSRVPSTCRPDLPDTLLRVVLHEPSGTRVSDDPAPVKRVYRVGGEHKGSPGYSVGFSGRARMALSLAGRRRRPGRPSGASAG